MSQITNLNVAPYYDDFDPTDNYHRVLFKPGYPVQARELTSLQSILQNQIERFGQHFFKEGAKVIPGNTAYSQNYFAVELNITFQGVPVDAYLDQLIGLKITGQRSGVTATVSSVLSSADSERGNPTLYVSYLGSSTQDNSTQVFFNGETIAAEGDIVSGLLGNEIIASGEPFCSTLAEDATSTGSSFSIVNGVYFIRGQFVNVADETLILDQYSNTPSYRIGLYVLEEIITPDQDEALTDNSQGYNNYAAPGADRLRVTTSLFKKPLTDFNDENFVELAVIENGILRSKKKTTQYNLIADELARRTYDESGNYYVKPFDVRCKESLNDGEGNRGVLEEGQLTPGGSVPRESLALYTVSPGKAYIQGYEIETISTTSLDAPKTRTTKTVDNESIFYNTGATLELNRVYGSPLVAAGSTYTVSLRSERVGSVGGAVGAAQTEPAGEEIGVARVYDFRLESGSYNTSNSDLNQWNVALFDVQTITKIQLNENTTLTTPVFVEGTASGATGFLKDSITDSAQITLYDTSGTFNKFEGFKFNGVSNGRVAVAITEFGMSDVQSVYGKVGVGTTFAADVIQTPTQPIGVADITTVNSSGESTITSTFAKFPGVLEVGDLVSYTSTDTAQTFTDPVFARVKTVNTSNVVVVGVTTVSGICQGRLPETAGGISVSDLTRIETQLTGSVDDSLYTPLPKDHIATVNVNDSHINIRKYAKVNITADGELSAAIELDENETFLPFDEERYSLIRSDDGTAEVLTADKFDFTLSNTKMQIRNLSGADTGSQLIYSIKKIKPTSKTKRKNRVNSIVVNKSKLVGSGIGLTTLNNGLTYGNYPFGTRVEDDRISLNEPDIIGIHAIYESRDTDEASAPTTTLNTLTGPSASTADLLVGEKFTGSTSKAKGVVAEILSDTQISFIRVNDFNFEEGETLVFDESAINGIVGTLDEPSIDVSKNYKFDSGQRSTFFGHGSISRKNGIDPASKQLKIYFVNAYFEESDSGDFVTANSYGDFDYIREIRSIDGVRNTDILDVRPAATTFTVSEGSRSPFEFYGRSFNRLGNSSNVLVSDDAFDISYSFYLPRIDRLYVTRDGKFLVKYGEPAEVPQKPGGVEDALEIATAHIPAYLYNVGDVQLDFLKYKRFRMDDIGKLEQRIKNLEYYTSLSLLETNTSNFFIPDEEGLNRFKSGFFVDNFTSVQAQEGSDGFKNSIDMPNKVLRPAHYTTSTDLIQGPVTGVDASADLRFAQPEGVNIRKSPNDIITLDYAEVEWLAQNFATRTESVTPFLISFWQGSLELIPATDTWIDTVRLEPKVIQTEGNYAETFNRMVDEQGIDPQTGFGPTIWNAWETNWTGQEITEFTRTRTDDFQAQVNRFGPGGTARQRSWINQVNVNTIEETFREVRDTGVMSRTGTRTQVTEQFDMESVGDRTVSRDVIPFMRSRNVSFFAKKVKPLTRLYPFFDGQDVSKYCVPKLLEIAMTSGTFQVGETVVGRPKEVGIQRLAPGAPGITFRVAQANHREGVYDSPDVVYRENPYNAQPLSETYSSTSTLLNIDTFSLSNQPQGDFFGYVATDMTLVGQTSGAQATITNVRLISDIGAYLQGSFFIPDPNIVSNPRFEAGTKVLTLVNDENNNQDVATTICEEGYTASGTLETVQENIISVRNARIENKREFEEQAVSRTTGVQLIDSQVVGQEQRTQRVTLWYDPLAQSFLVDDPTGIYLTKCDVFFRTKDDTDVPVTLQIRTMKGGLPTQKILPFSEIVLDPDQINLSADGSIATSFEFDAPVFLEGSTEYAICIASQSTKYSVYISRIGENDLLSDTFISNQPYLGSLFKSQNASTWEPSQWEDLKFVLYRADFVETGSVEFYNPSLKKGNNQIPLLTENPIKMNSKEVRVALSTDFNDPDLAFGNTIIQVGTNATADFVGTAGTANGTLQVINAGIGYTGPFTHTGVALTTVTGNGRNLTADIQIKQDGTVGFATVNTNNANPGGSGYQVGDVLGVTVIGQNNIGSGMRLSVTGIGRSSELLLNNVQGDFEVGVAKTIQFINSAGVTTTLNYAGGSALGPWPSPTEITTITDGTHIVVNHKNHGMYSSDNQVVLSGIRPDLKPTRLTAAYSASDTGTISVESVTNFQSFENIGVAVTNPGYLLIGDEIVGYTTATGGSINGITRGSNPAEYPVGTPVYKYETSGVSLRRLNKTHSLGDVTVADPISFDSYNIKVDMSSDGIDRTAASGWPKLFTTATKSTGGNQVRATQNIPYEILTPNVSNVTPKGTSVSATARTISAQSLSGVEVPFIDLGFENVNLNTPNYFTSARMVASDINAVNNLGNLPGNKSLNLSVQMATTDSRLSPVIDAQRVSAIYTSHRVNSVIQDFALDFRTGSVAGDPTAFKYVSQEMTLENGATSLKILTAAHFNPYMDVRAFYAIGNDRGFNPIFVPFPGYKNLNGQGEIINLQDSDGRSDKYVEVIQTPRAQGAPRSFQEISFTRDNLPTFKHFRVKLVLTSTNQAYPPALRDLRVIALA